MSFLGHMVSKEGVMLDLRKVEVVKNWARQTNVIEVHSSVGLVS